MTAQRPIPSGFGPHSTARDVLGDRRLDGTLAIVTGGYAGIGLETTRVLAAAGAEVIVPARSLTKARAALAGVERVTVEELDLADPASIEAFSARFLSTGRALPLLINNAGIMAVPLSRDARGFESHLATNHIGHFQLTTRLWPALERAHGARVVVLSSRGHMRSAFNFEDPHFEHRAYDKMVAYGQSKTANVLFAVALDARGQSAGIRAFAVHPGAILDTDLGRSMSPAEGAAVIERAAKLGGFKSIAEGAATTVWCATSPALDGKGGVYCEDADIAVAVPADHAGPDGVRPWAIDPESAERLWTVTTAWIAGS
ncbi:MAG: SDR family NAD(P)-dependent oxidoreductase [Deltaproteobacteria bacterium]|nr:SDR family NAD(P)-dependent oxidoreductase [Deltaproteobacteria bacterium]